ncbi:2-oxoglutarate (2OG) and Fe(II)-dependent oxygenase superfamily protein [Striga asiatica]|uniref:2-oxoglutarate (2OG) and Fe(II)-dependent oxygenase superfamily protein n=1 Tax=Striga asiatica TaxID=4170 RepID=A0A5A7NVG7_STRAF|nr:2-oxoglutarate (2OG) and Fe(II)-dependent oxygenase superfamily protein [Striga asiatica]
MEVMNISVQEMVKNPIHEIPSPYLVHQEPSISCPHEENSFAKIPILDLKMLLANKDSQENSNLEKFHSACKDWGIFQVVNHGVEPSLIKKVKNEVQGFYKLPLEERLKYKTRAGEVEGYGPTIIVSQDQKVDWADRIFMVTNPIHRRKSHLLPSFPKSLRETLEAYICELQKLASAIFGLISESLKIEKEEVEEMFENGMQAMRMTYYPPCPEPEKVHGLTPHSDGSGITILLQVNRVEGLKVKKDGVWMPVKFLPNAFVVNLGDIVEILSNGLYKSIEHKATVNQEKERISIAMFFNPKFEAEVGPSRSLINDKNPPIFRRMAMEQYLKEFFSRKLDGKSFIDYLKVKEGSLRDETKLI